MRERGRDWIRELVVGVAVGAAALLSIHFGALRSVERLAGDAMLRLAATTPALPPPGGADIAIVAIDAQSLREIPDWPWPRRLHAEATRRLAAAGARVIAFDIDFSTAREASGDAEFAGAIGESGRVVLATFKQRSELPGGIELEIANVPIDTIGRNAFGNGSVLIPVDEDGIVRRANRESEIGGVRIPSLGAVALAAATGQTPLPAETESFALDYRRVSPFPMLSIADVIAGRFDPREVSGRVVFVGATAAEFQDLWSTPLGPARPGVLLQALGYRTLAAARHGEAVLTNATPTTRMIVAGLLSLLVTLLGLAPHAVRLAALASLSLAIPAGALFAITRFGVALEPVTPIGVIALHYVLGLEGLRRRFGARLAERELSLSALFRVGEMTSSSSAGDGGLSLALALLGDLMGASGVALRRATAQGTRDRLAIDEQAVEWRRANAAAAPAIGDPAIGDPAIAAEVLGTRTLRVFEGHLPGAPKRTGLAAYLPLYAQETPVGVLVIERDDPRPLDATQIRTLGAIGTQLALSIENLRLLEGLRVTFDTSVAAIATAIEARDGYTEAHCRRLADLSVLMAGRLGLSERETEAIRHGALLHDVGKIGIRDAILLKPGRFTPEDREEMNRHPEIGHRIISGIHGIGKTTLDCIRHHHEWWDGSGYPDGLAGTEIPLAARIVSVVDVWDALATVRPYKTALPPGEVRDFLQKKKGVQFDPSLVDLLIGVLDDEWGESSS